MGTLVGTFVGTLTGTFVGTLVGTFAGTLTGMFVGTLVGPFEAHGDVRGDVRVYVRRDAHGEVRVVQKKHWSTKNGKRHSP